VRSWKEGDQGVFEPKTQHEKESGEARFTLKERWSWKGSNAGSGRKTYKKEKFGVPTSASFIDREGWKF